MKKAKTLLPFLLLVVLFMQGCSSGGNSSPSSPENNTGNTQVSMEPVKPPELTVDQLDQLKEGLKKHSPATLTFNVGGGNFYYVPNVIRVKQGDTVKIIFTNNGGFHNFVLDEFGIKFDPIKTGESKTVEFVADKKGRFEYYCSVANHRQMGQKGQLVVE